MAANAKPENGAEIVHPTVGFRLRYFKTQNKLRVIVVGARHLPSCIGTKCAKGYCFKVKMFPGKDKFETSVKEHKQPSFKEEFNFVLSDGSMSGKFLVITGYVVDPANKRVPIGHVNCVLDEKLFSRFSGLSVAESPDIWQRLEEIGSIRNKEGGGDKATQMLVSLKFCPNKDNANLLTVGISRLRLSVECANAWEQKKIQPYVKVSLLQGGKPLRKLKTRRVNPCISIPFDDVISVSLAKQSNLNDVMGRISLCNKSKFGRKTVLGSLIIGPSPNVKGTGADHWSDMVHAKGTNITKWHILTT